MSTFNSHPGLKIDATMTVGTEAADVINVAIQLNDRLNGNEVGAAVSLFWYLSTDAAGQVPASTAPDTLAIGTDGALIEWAANLSGLITLEADGDADLDFGENGDGFWYLNLVMPDGKLMTSAIIDFVHGAS